MPTKLRPNQKSYDRRTGVTSESYYYIKTISKKELFETLNNHNTRPKIKQKIRNELVRRGIKIVMVPINDGG
jgi:hypothetical protein